ncbi:MAG: transcription termination factor NusA [Patescibacteria group bacterium]|jgi:N utilization substance protein A|nr:transcription termination factor NusA [Patescibacteria group bacterium]
MDKQFASAINQICTEKNISKEVVIATIEDALAAAYKKDYGNKKQEVRVELSEDGETLVFVSKEVVEEVEDKFTQISLTDAYKLKKSAKVGDIIEIKDFPSDFGRIAAQTAKQVIIQRIREAERDMVFGEYKDKEGEVINGTIQRIEGSNVIVDIGKASGILFPNEQIKEERYYVGQRLKFFVVRVEQNARGPQIVISRSHPGLVKRLFELEVPEILSGVVEIKSIAREAGERTKIAVQSTQEGVDPVGSCVGQRGVRVQAVMSEIGEEKIDIILWDEDPKVFISNSLSPAKVSEIILNEGEQKAEVRVAEDQLSLAIGRQGQNVRLAAKLTGWNVDIQGGDESGVEAATKMVHPVEDKRDLEEEILKAVESTEPEALEGAEKKEKTDVVDKGNEPIQQETAEDKTSDPDAKKALDTPVKAGQADVTDVSSDTAKDEAKPAKDEQKTDEVSKVLEEESAQKTS